MPMLGTGRFRTTSGSPATRAAWVLLLGTLVASTACQDEATKKCKALYESSQQVVVEIDDQDLDNVQATLDAVDQALEACKASQDHGEVDQLTDAHRKIKAHRDALQKRADRPQRAELSEKELERLKKHGDPDCPKGQGYEHGESKTLIKCSGPQLVGMGRSRAKKYFDNRGYTVKEDETTLKAEYGAEAYVFTFDAGSKVKPPKCLTISGAPGVPWQEVTARATGVHPNELKRDEPVKWSGGELPLTVKDATEGAGGQVVVQLGTCGA